MCSNNFLCNGHSETHFSGISFERRDCCSRKSIEKCHLQNIIHIFIIPSLSKQSKKIRVLVIFRVQFRYGSAWALKHPSSGNGAVYTATLDAGESLQSLEFWARYIIDFIRLNTTRRSSGRLGRNLRSEYDILPLKGAMYFTGADAFFCDQTMVTKLTARMSYCNK